MKNIKNKILAWIVISSINLVWFANASTTISKVSIMPSIPVEIEKPQFEKQQYWKYGSILKNNVIKADYQYNNNNFYSKKLLINVSIPKELKKELNEVYLILGNQRNDYNIYYNQKIVSEALSNKSLEKVKEPDFSNVIKFKIDKDNIPEEHVFKFSDIEDKITSNDKYWKSFTVKIYWKLTDWKEISLSNNSYIRFNVNSIESKKNYLNNKMHSKYRIGYININKKIDPILKRIKIKHWVEKYIEILDKINDKLISLTKEFKSKEKVLLNSINDEKWFNLKLKEYYLLEMKKQTLNQIKWIVWREIKENKGNKIIEDIFWEYYQ